MRRFVLGTVAASGAAYAAHRLARKMHTHCQEMMRSHCGDRSTYGEQH